MEAELALAAALGVSNEDVQKIAAGINALKTKELVGKKIQTTAHVIKDLGEIGVEKSGDGTDDGLCWFYASVEIEDSAMDVVRIAGIDTDTYHAPPRRSMKVLAQHESSSPTTGEAFILGRVEAFKRGKTVVGDKIVPSLAFGFSWAKDGEGTLTPLAKSYKDLVDGGYLDSCSVGMLVRDYEALDSGGIDYTSTTLYEISLVSVPANPLANRISGKAIKDISDDVLTTKLAEVEQKLDLLLDLITKRAEADVKTALAVESTSTASEVLKGLISSLASSTSEQIERLMDRLDGLEAATVVTSAVQSPKTDDRKVETTRQALADIRDTIRQFAGR